MLYGWCAREAKRRGWRKIITYTRVDEAGTSLRAAGWNVEAKTRGRGWRGGKRARSNTNAWIDKVRWGKTLRAEAAETAPFVVPAKRWPHEEAKFREKTSAARNEPDHRLLPDFAESLPSVLCNSRLRDGSDTTSSATAPRPDRGKGPALHAGPAPPAAPLPRPVRRGAGEG